MSINKKNSIDHFSKISNKYEELWMFSKEYEQQMLSNILSRLSFSIDDKFVDIGGGNGKYTLNVARKAHLCNEPICVEPSNLADIAKENTNLFVYKEDAISFAKRDKKYDKVLIKEAIHHIPNRTEFFKELKKRLPLNGKLLIVTRPQHPPLPFFKKQKEIFASGQPHHDEIAKELLTAGFKVEITNDFFTFEMEKERWFNLQRERFMSDLSKLTDDEIEDGIKELSQEFQDKDKIEITDEIIYILAEPNIGGEMVKNGMRQIMETR